MNVKANSEPGCKSRIAVILPAAGSTRPHTVLAFHVMRTAEGETKHTGVHCDCPGMLEYELTPHFWHTVWPRNPLYLPLSLLLFIKSSVSARMQS